MSIYISLGWNCAPAIMRKNIFKQYKKTGYLTTPFDLCVTPYEGLCKCLEENFTNFFDLRMENNIIMNAYDMWFNHEQPFMFYSENNFAEFKNRYNARIENFRNYLSSNKFIYFIHSNPFESSIKLYNIIEKIYPKLKYLIISIMNADVDLYKTHFSLNSDCKAHSKLNVNLIPINTNNTKNIVYIKNNDDYTKIIELYKDYFMCTNKYGKYCVPKGNLKGIDWILSNNFVHEEQTLLFIKNNVSEGSIITAGAHIGSFLPFLSMSCKTVYAFEPDPENFRYSILNIDNNKLTNVILKNYALSSYDGVITMKTENLIEKSLCRVSIYDYDLTTKCHKLDTIFHDVNDNINIIQLDVQLHEYDILNGAINLITKHKPIIITEELITKELPTFLIELNYIKHCLKINDNVIFYIPNVHSLQTH